MLRKSLFGSIVWDSLEGGKENVEVDLNWKAPWSNLSVKNNQHYTYSRRRGSSQNKKLSLQCSREHCRPDETSVLKLNPTPHRTFTFSDKTIPSPYELPTTSPGISTGSLSEKFATSFITAAASGLPAAFIKSSILSHSNVACTQYGASGPNLSTFHALSPYCVQLFCASGMWVEM